MMAIISNNIEIRYYLLALSTLLLTNCIVQRSAAFVPSVYRTPCRPTASLANHGSIRRITRLNYRIEDDKTNTDNDEKVIIPTSSSKLRSNPITFLTTPSLPGSFVRWHTVDDNNNNRWEMQTAVTTFVHPITNVRIEVHALLHYGDNEYYDYYNSQQFNNNEDDDDDSPYVLYELLLDETLVTTNQYGQRTVRINDNNNINNLQASPKDQEMAKHYGWICQVDGIDYEGNTRRYKNRWIHADFTRQELLKLQQKQNKLAPNSKSPLEAVLGRFGVASEAVAALLVGPPMVQQQQQQRRRQRRLFTNLFLSGDSFAIFLRWILWCTVPCPEISILLLDSSSVWLDGTKSAKLIPSFSPMVVPLVQALGAGKIQDFRRLLFGQVIAATNSVINDPNTSSSPNIMSNSNNVWDIIVTQRNDKAIQVLNDELRRNNKTKKVSILYGSSHCPDLYQKLIAQGYKPTDCTWRTAWSVQTIPVATTNNPQQQGVTILSGSQTTLLLPALILLATYLGIGALDWIGTMHDVVVSATSGTDSKQLDAVTDTVAYLIRHVVLYVVFSRFVVDWKKAASAT